MRTPTPAPDDATAARATARPATATATATAPASSPAAALPSASASAPAQAQAHLQRAGWRGLYSGLIVGLMAVVSSVSFAALVYSGPLSAFVGYGVALALLATAFNTAVVARLATLPGTVGGSQSLPAAILATSAAAVAHAVQAHADGDAAPQALLASVGAAMLLSTVLTGIVLMLLGHGRAGRLVRFLPYPVLGGVIAGSGWLLAKGALGIMVSADPAGTGLANLLHWLPGLLWAVLMFVVCLRSSHPRVLLGLVALGVVVFFGAAWAAGLSLADLAADGWLLQTPAPEAEPMSISRLDWTAIDWQALASVWAELATVPLVTAVALLLNAAGLETATRKPVDFDRELRSAGVANVASGLFGGFAGYQQLGLSLMNMRAGAASRWVGLWAALVCVAVLVFGTGALAWLPRPVLGALLLLLALMMVHDWVVASWHQLSTVDHGIVVLIVAVTATLGFLPAVLLGLGAAVLMFAFHYSRIDPVRQLLSGAVYRSRVARPPAQARWLQHHGDALLVLQLQGFLFFGIADRLLVCARQRLQDETASPLRYLLLDCRRVTGCDSSAAQSFARLQQLLSEHGAELVVCDASPALRAQMHAADAQPAAGRCHHLDDLDHGLEWCEASLLQAAGHDPREQPADSLREALAPDFGGAAAVEALFAVMQRVELQPGQTLIEQGEAADDLYLLESGSMSAQRMRADAAPLRLQTMSGGGAVFGEIGFFLNEPRTAAVVAITPAVVWRLAKADLHRLEAQQPALAMALHRLLARLLAARVAHLVGLVAALER